MVPQAESDDPIFAGLNPPQREAVRRMDGPLLVLAGAGTGKTRVITHRIAWMIEQGVPPASILGVTFTNKAAREVRQRVERLSGRSGARLSTFHSFCASFLREEFPNFGRAASFTIYDEGDSLALVRKVVDAMELDAEHHKPAGLRDAISNWKNAFVLPAEAVERARGTVEADAAQVYAAYDQRLYEANACDFDDLLIQTLRLLREDQETLERWQRRLTHLLVDEFQDTNAVQYELVRVLTGDRGNLCVTGDQDQSIYSWRGADVRNFDRFLADFPGAGIVKLEQNYRSSGNILSGASTLIARNRQRIPKRLWTEAPAGEPIRVVGFGDDWEEALAVATEIRKNLEAGLAHGEVAVLFRTNALSLPVERALLQTGIPYQVVGGLEFFARTEVKDVLAWLRFLANPSDSVSFDRLLDAPPRGIGASTRGKLLELARAAGRPVGELLRGRTGTTGFSARAEKAIVSFRTLLQDLDAVVTDAGAGSVARIIKEVLDRSGFRTHFEHKASKSGSLDPWQNIGQLVNLAGEYDETRAGTLIDFLAEISLLTDLDRGGEGQEPVSLMTLHSAKGLEFSLVFIIGVDRELLPHAVSRRSPGGVEEERRLLHVGMTRARQRLTLSYASRRTKFGASQMSGPSGFLDEIGRAGVERYGDIFATGSSRGSQAEGPDEFSLEAEFEADHPLARIRKGGRVRHPDYGPGVVLEFRGRLSGPERRVLVRFDDESDRLFVLRHSKLESLDDDPFES